MEILWFSKRTIIKIKNDVSLKMFYLIEKEQNKYQWVSCAKIQGVKILLGANSKDNLFFLMSDDTKSMK